MCLLFESWKMLPVKIKRSAFSPSLDFGSIPQHDEICSSKVQQGLDNVLHLFPCIDYISRARGFFCKHDIPLHPSDISITSKMNPNKNASSIPLTTAIYCSNWKQSELGKLLRSNFVRLDFVEMWLR